MRGPAQIELTPRLASCLSGLPPCAASGTIHSLDQAALDRRASGSIPPLTPPDSARASEAEEADESFRAGKKKKKRSSIAARQAGGKGRVMSRNAYLGAHLDLAWLGEVWLRTAGSGRRALSSGTRI